MVALTASAMIVSSASAAKTLKIQLAVPTTSDEAKIVQDFADDVRLRKYFPGENLG